MPLPKFEPCSGIVITPDGQVIPTEPTNGTDYKHDQLHDIVGGWIEIVPLIGVQIDNLGDDLIMVVNEEGKLLELDFNPVATEIWHQVHGDDYIAGAVLITTSGRIK